MESTKDKTIEEPTNFHEDIALKYNDWLLNSQERIYRPNNFDGDWLKSGALEYMMHRLSILGLGRDRNSVSATDVQKTLRTYTESLLNNPDKVAIIQSAYRDFNDKMVPLGFPLLEYKTSALFLLPIGRIHELSGDSETVGFTLKSSGLEILLPIDDIDIDENPDYLYDCAIHELTHKSRNQLSLADFKHNNFEEGLVQVNAIDIERQKGKLSDRSEGIYQVQVSMIQNLQKALGVSTLVNFNYVDIRRLMAEKYANGLAFNSFCEDMDKLSGFFQKQLSKITGDAAAEELDRINGAIQNAKLAIYKKWKFIE
jgi:hypothetical protein